jgi:hypothetical protein
MLNIHGAQGRDGGGGSAQLKCLDLLGKNSKKLQNTTNLLSSKQLQTKRMPNPNL